MMTQVTVTKCPCIVEGCSDYHLVGLGKFIHGSGFTKAEAETLALIWNEIAGSDLYSMYDSVYKVNAFHHKFDLPKGGEDVLTGDDEIFDFRRRFLQEELDELCEAYLRGDRVKMFDALLDLVYVAQGTAFFLGVSTLQWLQGMAAVQEANMSKERAMPDASNSKRASPWDVVKPKGWKGPEDRLREILDE